MKEKLSKLFDELFDGIFLIYYTGNLDRIKHLINELDRVGLLQCKNFHWYYDTLTPHDEEMYRTLKLAHPKHEENNIIIKKLSLHHYKIAKISYELGYNRILILEDDICFLNDLELLYNELKNTPDDGDIILYDKFIQFCNKDQHEKLYNGMMYYDYSCVNVYNIMFASCAMYALSKKGMYERILNGNDNLCAADDYTNNFNNIFKYNTSKKYAVNINCGIQNTPRYFNQFYNFLDINTYNLPETEYKNFIH